MTGLSFDERSAQSRHTSFSPGVIYRAMPSIDTLLAAHAPWASAERTWSVTPFELFMWLDDRPRYPLVFQVVLRFEGPVDVAAMRDAFRFALGRHPLLRATIVDDRHGAHWHAQASGWNELEVVPRESPPESGLGWIDLAAGPGLRGRIHETATGSDVTLVFHHACCDGQGARMFIQDLALAYAVLRGVATEDAFMKLDAAQLDFRGIHACEPSVWRGMHHLFHMFRTRPLPTVPEAGLAAGPAADAAPGSRIGFCMHTFDRETVRHLQDPRRLGEASFNDVAVALLFTVLDSWQRNQGVKPGARMRISVPVDLRGREHERMPAANRYTYLFVNRHVGVAADWPDLLADARRQLRLPRQAAAGSDMLSMLHTFARWPRLMRRGLHWRRCFATAVLTNLSDPSRRLRKRLPVDDEGCIWLDRARCYDMQLCTPPLRPCTHWGFGLFEYANRVTVTFRYDTDTISPPTAAGVLAEYVAAWRSWAEEHP